MTAAPAIEETASAAEQAAAAAEPAAAEEALAAEEEASYTWRAPRIVFVDIVLGAGLGISIY